MNVRILQHHSRGGCWGCLWLGQWWEKSCCCLPHVLRTQKAPDWRVYVCESECMCVLPQFPWTLFIHFVLRSSIPWVFPLGPRLIYCTRRHCHCSRVKAQPLLKKRLRAGEAIWTVLCKSLWATRISFCMTPSICSAHSCLTHHQSSWCPSRCSHWFATGASESL